ncbi:AAA protein [Oryctes borbonicus]|uniref:Origin recognition complex subunit 1 n=1 Tax=Oryctes borbonicus TaxID=1629725 RepID=A0A0T6BHG6_9SCAR|nr:AAA protein [Oryctes borbonicus]
MENFDSPNRRSSARRNLNESFNDSGNIVSPVHNYSIVNAEENYLGIKLRKSKRNPQVILKRSDEEIFSKYIEGGLCTGNRHIENLSPTKSISELSQCFQNNLQLSKNISYTKGNIEQQSKCEKDLHAYIKENISNQHDAQRRSRRNLPRKSYAEFISPAKTPKRNRKQSTSSESSGINGIECLSPSKKTNLQTPSKSKSKTQSKQMCSTFMKQSPNKYKGAESNEERVQASVQITKSGRNIITRAKYLETEEVVVTPERGKHKRNVNIPSRYDSYIISPTKKKRGENRKTHSSNDEIDIEIKGCFVKINKCNDIDSFSPSNMRSTRHSSLLKMENDRCSTPKKPCEKEKNLNTDMKTPDRKLATLDTPKTMIKATPTAKARLIREGIITPSMQRRATPIQKNCTPLNKAREKLHVSYLPKTLPCRENEYNNILNFLERKLLDGCGGCMYVSGVPGTGKTATVTDVIRKLEEKSERGTVPSFQFININGMKLSEPRQTYVEILKQLSGKTVSWEQAQLLLDTKFTKQIKKSTPIIVLVDELDILCTKRQDVVYNLLDWPTRVSVQLIVITIANTMDLPERLLMGRVTSRLGLTRLTFQAYTHKQLQEIVTMRLMGTKIFNPDAIQLVARKVASVSGDARRALDICRRAVEIAESEGANTLVSMNHVNEALNAMITQPKVKAIKHCSRLQQLILQSIVAEVIICIFLKICSSLN